MKLMLVVTDGYILLNIGKGLLQVHILIYGIVLLCMVNGY